MGPAKLLLAVMLLSSTAPMIAIQPLDYSRPMANLSTLWTNNNNSLNYFYYDDDVVSLVRPIFVRPMKTLSGLSFAAGFFCSSASCYGEGAGFLFAVFILNTDGGGDVIPQLVWFANRLSPVRQDATLELTGDGDLILREVDGRRIWSSGTAGRSIAGMEITELGNLVLFDMKNTTVWQSFDHPTDVLLPGQSLLEGTKLAANTSATNFTQNRLFMTVLPDGLYAYVDSTPPQSYFSLTVSENMTGNHQIQVTFTNGSLCIFLQSSSLLLDSITLPAAKSTQYMRFESDGHLRLYEWSEAEGNWTMVCDVINFFHNDCLPDSLWGVRGMHRRAMQLSKLLQAYRPMEGEYWLCAAESNLLTNCSCQAVMFVYGNNESNGDCLWLTEVFSLQSIQPQHVNYNSSFYLKVQQLSHSPGYLAPEWLTSQITEKVDIYSFGIVVMEVICGRKNIDNSQPEERIHLINLLREKAKNNQLTDMIDNQSHDMVSHQEEVIQMMKLALWCLQNDSNRRPSMSTVVKVLEGAKMLETCIDYSFFNADPVLSYPQNLLRGGCLL